MTKGKQVFRHITFTLVFRPFAQYFVEAPLAVITEFSRLECDATSLAQLMGELPNYFSAYHLKICQLRHSYFQVSPEMFDRVQVRDLAGPL